MAKVSFVDVMAIFEGSNGDARKELYAELEKRGTAGVVALNLFRAHKTSSRAKVYRGGVPGKGSYRAMSYDRKAWSIGNLCKVLAANDARLDVAWGWGVDPDQEVHRFVLYVDTPHGQVSFHVGERGPGPDYPGKWDGIRGMGPTRICRWVRDVLNGGDDGA